MRQPMSIKQLGSSIVEQNIVCYPKQVLKMYAYKIKIRTTDKQKKKKRRKNK